MYLKSTPKTCKNCVDDTVDGRNPAPPGMLLNPCKYWDKLPTSTGAGFLNHLFFVNGPGSTWENSPKVTFSRQGSFVGTGRC